MQQVFISLPVSEFMSLVEDRVKEALANFLPAPQIKQAEKPITIKEVCQLLGKSEVTIHAWKKKGLIPFHRISGKIYFYESEVLSALKLVGRRAA